MTELIFGIIFVMICGFAETVCSKNERVATFSGITLFAIIFAIGSSDWTYILYPIGIIICFFVFSWIQGKRKHQRIT